MTLLHDAYTAWLAGITTKTGNEIHWRDKYGNPITIEPVDVSKEKYIIRTYYSNGNKQYKLEYQNNKCHGKETFWGTGGNKLYEKNYRNGRPHGKHISWDADGNKLWEMEHREGVRIK